MPPPPLVVADYRAIGTEPFWDLTFGRELVFTDRGNGVSVREPAPAAQIGTAGMSYRGRRLSVDIVRRACSDGMSDRIYPDTVSLSVDGQAYRGCGASLGFFAQPHQAGSAEVMVGRWIAVELDGRLLAPPQRFVLGVTETMITTSGICNEVRGQYRLPAERLLPVGPWARTERGCEPDRMAFENVVHAAFQAGPTVRFTGPNRLILDSARGRLTFDRAP